MKYLSVTCTVTLESPVSRILPVPASHLPANSSLYLSTTQSWQRALASAHGDKPLCGSSLEGFRTPARYILRDCNTWKVIFKLTKVTDICPLWPALCLHCGWLKSLLILQCFPRSQPRDLDCKAEHITETHSEVGHRDKEVWGDSCGRAGLSRTGGRGRELLWRGGSRTCWKST